MSSRTKVIASILCGACLVAAVVVAEDGTAPEGTIAAEAAADAGAAPADELDGGVGPDAGEGADAGGGLAGEGAPAAAPGDASPPIDESQYPEAEEPIAEEPFAEGEMEVGVGLAMAGSGDYFYFGAGGNFAYYVIDRLAPGIQINYTHIFLSKDYGYSEPHTITALPYLKFVILRSRKVAPYLLVAGGYQFEWGSQFATDAWIAGGGGGVHVGLGEHFSINVQLLALYYWYDGTRVYLYDDDLFVEEDPETGFKYFESDCRVENGVNVCARHYKADDKKDVSSELFFPLITFGIAFVF